MGARQIPRDVARLVSLSWLIVGTIGLGLGLGATAHAAPELEPVVVVDLRPGDAEGLRGSRADFAAELDGIQGIKIKTEDGLDGALAGEASDTDAAEVLTALDEARAQFGDLDCPAATAAADRAIDLLAARQASGLDDGTALRGAWAIVLLCADQAGDRVRAQSAADHLRAIGIVDAEDVGISPATWDRFPEIDAHVESAGVALTITTEPVGAAVWVDHVAAGASPVTVYVTPGEHVVAAGQSSRRASARVVATGKTSATALALVDRTGIYSAVAGVVKSWRDGKLTPTAEALGTVMQRLEVRFALILSGKSTVQVWAMGPGDDKPRKVDDASRADAMGIGALVTDRIAAWDASGPDPDHPLLRETPGETPGERDGRKGAPQRWWVYAAIIGAVAVGSAILYFQDAADDHQRITLRF